MVIFYIICPRCKHICDPFSNYCPECGRSLHGVRVRYAETLDEVYRVQERMESGKGDRNG